MTSKEATNQLIWVQEHLGQIQVAYQKTLLSAPFLQEVIPDFSGFTKILFAITKNAIQLSELLHMDYSASQIGQRLENTEQLLNEVENNKDDILSKVKELIGYYNNLAELASDISGKENAELPYDAYRYMKTLREYISTEYGKTETQLLELKKLSKSDYTTLSNISIHSNHADKQKYIEVQKIIARVTKCYIALAGHTQLSINPILKTAHEVIELDSCPTCHFLVTIFRLLSPSLASLTLKRFVNEQCHILSLGCGKAIDQSTISNSIIYNVLFEEIRSFETLDSFQCESAMKIHQYDTPRGLDQGMLSYSESINSNEIWDIVNLLVNSFPVQQDLHHLEQNQLINTSDSHNGITISACSTMEGLATVTLKQSKASFAEQREIKNIRLDHIWLLVSYLASFLVKTVQ